MKIVKPNYEILTPIDKDGVYKHLEEVGRVCYKSEDKITPASAEKFLGSLIKNGHEAIIEHFSFSVKFICDRGISHEIVRHRLFSFAQESTRYCNYNKDKFGNEITVIEPSFFIKNKDEHVYAIWYESMLQSQRKYFQLLEHGATPQEARAVLPNSLKTELVVTGNLREWRHFF